MPDFSETIQEFVAGSDVNVQPLPESTLNALRDAWQRALSEAANSSTRLAPTQVCSGVDIVGHVVFLAAYVETIVNRHLFFLRESGSLQPSYHNSLDRVEVIPKLLFAFKDEIARGEMNITNIKSLVSLRNKALHRRSGQTVQPTVASLLSIWSEVGRLAQSIAGDPIEVQITSLVTEWADRWLSR